MKKLITMIVSLAILSLACLESSNAALIEGEMVRPAESATAGWAEPARPVKVVQSATISPAQCARVIAVQSVNLRDVAGAGGDVLTWLNNGELVRVLDSTSGAWWMVASGDLVGWVRSDYLQGTECGA